MIRDLSGLTVITGPNCPGCVKLKNMLKKINRRFREINFEAVSFLKLTDRNGFAVYPILLNNGQKVFEGCPGTIKELKEKLRGLQ